MSTIKSPDGVSRGYSGVSPEKNVEASQGIGTGLEHRVVQLGRSEKRKAAEPPQRATPATLRLLDSATGLIRSHRPQLQGRHVVRRKTVGWRVQLRALSCLLPFPAIVAQHPSAPGCCAAEHGAGGAPT